MDPRYDVTAAERRAKRGDAKPLPARWATGIQAIQREDGTIEAVNPERRKRRHRERVLRELDQVDLRLAEHSNWKRSKTGKRELRRRRRARAS